MITTINGEMDESLLDKIEGIIDNSNEYTTWVEYRLKGTSEPFVHRSAHVTLKYPLISSTFIGE